MRDPTDTPLPERRRFHILLVARFLVAIACLTALIALEGGQILSSPLYMYVYFLLLLLCIADLAYVPLFRRVVSSTLAQGIVQAAVDLLFVTALVFLSGGGNSPFVVLFFGAVVAGALYFSPIGAVSYGALSAGILFGIVVLFHTAALNGWEIPLISPSTMDEHMDLQRTAGALVLPAFGLVGVAFLTSRLTAASRRERVVMEEILDGMGDGVVSVDPGGRIIFINRAARHLLSLPVDFTSLGKPFEVLLKAARLKSALQDKPVGPAGSATVEVAPEDGAHRVLHITSSPVEGPKGRSRGSVHLLRDLTIQKRMEEALKKADRLQDVSQMAAGIAHEIRNPLASIRGSIQELHTSDLLRDDDKRLMKVILRECDRLNRITEDFLRFAERQSLAVAPTDVGRALSDLETYFSRHPAKGATSIRVEKEGDLVIRADAEGIRQVLINLCLNALESMDGSGSLHVRAFEKRSIPPPREGGQPPTGQVDGVAVEVADTGEGIPAEILDRIFHPFYSTKPKGFGLGLSLVFRIVDAHGGTVKVDSHPGAGSTFSVWLPRNEVTE